MGDLVNRRGVLILAVISLQFRLLAGGLPSTSQFFPEVGDGGGLRTIFLLMNPGSQPCQVALDLFRDSGTTWTLSLNEYAGPNISLTIPAGGSVRLATPGEAGSASVGWARMTSDHPVAAQALFEIRNGGTLVTQAAVEASGPNRNLDFFFDQTGGTNTGIALANFLSTAPVKVYISEFTEDGTPNGDTSITLDPGQQTAQFVSKLLGNEPRKGSLRIEATGPIVATTLQQTGLVLATLPVVTRVLKSQ